LHNDQPVREREREDNGLHAQIRASSPKG
jgi:hypothetical protein